MSTHPVAVAASDLEDANWITSSYSNGGGNCVEVAELAHAVAIRDSKNPTGPALTLSRHAFAALLATTRTEG
ncbi:DUF397 domain-containing protein [Streptomyces sp. NRRL F-5126]|uniref:DUF397 domain-containing protein n=1 Tax=Streptomyces sp. NRRL F-5126 TaxID=1463857 RepID=UPI0004C91A9A|nr:DUF397 domain-containing protein [Streptomyces sp. NRRL F-5126]